MKTNKLTPKALICFTIMLCLYTKLWLQPSEETKTGSATLLLISVELCCSFKIEKLANRLAISLTIGS